MLIRSINGIGNIEYENEFLYGAYRFEDEEMYGSLCAKVDRYVSTAISNKDTFILKTNFYIFRSAERKSVSGGIEYHFTFKKSYKINNFDKFDLNFFEDWFVAADKNVAARRVEEISRSKRELELKRLQNKNQDAEESKNPVKSLDELLVKTSKRRGKKNKFKPYNRQSIKSKHKPAIKKKRVSNKTISKYVGTIVVKPVVKPNKLENNIKGLENIK